jgi:DNA modification methylase
MTIQLFEGDSASVLKTLTPESIDLTVTSPPYDNLRTYKGYSFDFEAIAKELFRVTKKGGVVIWIVGDATVDGSETGTSFRQALFFKEIGFNLHDTMIYEKAGTGACGSRLSYWQSFEFMFVLSKQRPRTINLIADTKNARAGGICTKGRLTKDGREKDAKRRVIPTFSIRTNIWRIQAGNNGDDKINHPARFPEKLVRDHILSWSNPGDTVLDPFLGSGTTGKMAVLNDRNFIGIEISAEYLQIAKNRIESARLSRLPDSF